MASSNQTITLVVVETDPTEQDAARGSLCYGTAHERTSGQRAGTGEPPDRGRPRGRGAGVEGALLSRPDGAARTMGRIPRLGSRDPRGPGRGRGERGGLR